MHPVKIENDSISIEVWPTLGGKVSSLIDKVDQYDLLFNYPAELPDSPRYDSSYGNHWSCGWDECFPAVAPSVYPRHPYNGIAVPDHGELWGIPATTAVPAKDGITTVFHGLRFGYRLTRKVYLEANAVTAEYTLNNLAPFEFRYVWCMHALLSMVQPVQIVNPEAGLYRLSHNESGDHLDVPYNWPTTPTGEDFSQPAMLPARRAWKSYSTDPIERTLTLVYPTRHRRLTFEYSSVDGQPAYWGIWINTGAWAGKPHLAIEPTTGRYDEIDRSIKDASAGLVGPFEKRQWSVKCTLSSD
jgi:hypothetical protein